MKIDTVQMVSHPLSTFAATAVLRALSKLQPTIDIAHHAAVTCRVGSERHCVRHEIDEAANVGGALTANKARTTMMTASVSHSGRKYSFISDGQVPPVNSCHSSRRTCQNS